MFEPEGLGKSIFQERYALHEGESWDEACRRVAKWAASCEDRTKIGEVEENFYRILRSGLFMPGGRIWYAAGRPFAQALNCFVLPVSDSREGIGKLFHDTMVVSGTGGGIGVNFSSLRGRGSPIHGMGGSSTGAVSFMKAQNAIGEQIIAGGSRRTALMQCLDVDHPDITEFIKAKAARHELNNANISIVIPKHFKDTDFVSMVRNRDLIKSTHNGKYTGDAVNAGWFWENIVHNAWESGEPGVLNGYLANLANSISYKHDLISTNPCGEIWLPGYGCCDLGALVLPRFVDEYTKQVDWWALQDTIEWAVRFLDNVLTVTQYPLPEIKEMAQGERRIGLGVMGLHSMLLDLNYRYSGADIILEVLFENIQDMSIKASMSLAKEKGPFAFYDPHKFPNAERYPNGLRNCALLTVAPTGTTSMVQGVTSGIEPMFSPLYIRRRFVNGEIVGDRYHQSTLVISKDFTDHMGYAEGAYDISPEAHFHVQAIVQKYMDNAVSKTINIPKGYDEHSLSDLWLEYLPRVKGSTFYREGSRENEPLEYVPTRDALEVLQSWEGDVENEDGSTSIDACISGLCDI